MRTLHGAVSILIQYLKLTANVGNMDAINNKMPFISQCLGLAQNAAAQVLKVVMDRHRVG